MESKSYFSYVGDKKYLISGSNFYLIKEGYKAVVVPAQYLHNYWRNPDEHNNPNDYSHEDCLERSLKLVSLFDKYCSKDDKILEIGCNVGRNIHHLYNAGYKNISGVEINKTAIDLGKKIYPETIANFPIACEAVEDFILRIPDNTYDVVFTLGVLMHIHPSSEWIFNYIKSITKKYIIVSEEEEGVSDIAFSRNYKEIFENLGMEEVFQEYVERPNKINSDGDIKLQYRVFKK